MDGNHAEKGARKGSPLGNGSDRCEPVPVLGAILAGGLGKRLGRPKAGVLLAGRPLISYGVAAFGEAGIEAVVIAKPESELPPLPVPTIEEPAEPRHPLCGIVAALSHAEKLGRSAAVVLACDMPLVPAGLLSRLAGFDHPLVMAAIDARPQPLLARYSTSVLPLLQKELGENPVVPLRTVVNGLRPHLLGEDELVRFGDPRRMLHNVNTPDDLALAETLLAGP